MNETNAQSSSQRQNVGFIYAPFPLTTIHGRKNDVVNKGQAKSSGRDSVRWSSALMVGLQASDGRRLQR